MLDQSSEVLHLHYQNIRTICTANVLDILETLTLKRNVSAEFIMLMAEITTLEIQPIVVNALSRCRANMKEAFPRSWLLFLDNHNSTLFASILTCHYTFLILHILTVLKLVVLHNYMYILLFSRHAFTIHEIFKVKFPDHGYVSAFTLKS